MSAKRFSLYESVLIFLRGLCMGIADVIPGVSGGTIAFITGIYGRFIHALSTLDFSFIPQIFQGQFKKAWRTIKKIDFALFIPLGLGIVLAILIFSRIVKYLLDFHIVTTFAFFFGLIVASALFLFKSAGKFTFERAIFGVFGFLGAYLLAGLSAGMANHSLIFLFFSGALAICAMLLPGISGSFILLLLGQYEFLIDSLHALKISIILTFIAGALTGLFTFSKLIDYALRHFKGLTISFLIGLMVGSLRVPWVEITTNGGLTLTALVAGIFGFLIVFALENVFGKK